MRQRLALLAGVAFGLALARLFRRRGRSAPALPLDPRAEGLRRKLAESRTDVAAEASPPAAPAPAVPPPAEPATAAETAPDEEVDDARRRVHEEGRAAVEEMRRSGDAPAA